MNTGTRFGVVGALALVACAGDPRTEPDDFAELAIAGVKGDAFEDMIVGSIEYGEVLGGIAYRYPPRYRIVKFAADAGDRIDLRVRSLDGDPMAWILDDDLSLLGYNDDASSSTLNARVRLEIPAHPSRTHYVVVREYHHADATFQIELGGDPAGCLRDTDCAMVEAGCCDVGDWTAVPVDEVEAFEAAKGCDPEAVCPLIPIVYRGEQAICQGETRTCAIALPADLDCGGFSPNPHACPDGWRCVGPDLATDGTGVCLQTCGGLAARPCPDGFACADDPDDDCDPEAGGADCGGLCLAD
jgi:hypothetical protein